MPKIQIPITKQSLPTRGIDSSSQIWIKQKTLRDSQLWGNSKKIWIIENKTYDLTDYIQKHPGGKHWLEYTKGQDITEHFISHHLNQEKARKVLQSYYVQECKIKQTPRFTFEQNGLYKTIKNRLLKQTSIQQLQNYSKSKINAIQFIILWFTFFFLSAYFQSYILAILCGILLFPIIGIAHNFVHLKTNFFRYCFMFTGFTHKQWERMHCLSHHAYPNTLIDYQIQAIQPIAYYLDCLPKNKIRRLIIKEVALFLLAPSNIIIKLLVVPITQKTAPQWQYLIPLLQIPLLFVITDNWFLSFKIFLTIHLSFSFLFGKLAFLGHRTQQTWTEGNKQIQDYAEHQIRSSSDMNTNDLSGFLSYMFYAGFNYHAIHHLFPTIDNHSLPKVNKILVQQADKMGVKLNIINSIIEGLISVEKRFLRLVQHKKSN